MEELQKELEQSKQNVLSAAADLERVSQEKAFAEESLNKMIQEDFNKRYDEVLQAKAQSEEGWKAQLAELQETARNTERELNNKASSERLEKEIAQSRLGELEIELKEISQKLSRKSEDVQSLSAELQKCKDCLRSKETEAEDFTAKLQTIHNAASQKERDYNVQINELTMKLSQIHSETEVTFL